MNLAQASSGRSITSGSLLRTPTLLSHKPLGARLPDGPLRPRRMSVKQQSATPGRRWGSPTFLRPTRSKLEAALADDNGSLVYDNGSTTGGGEARRLT
jgi:hypothetical protein